MSSNHMRLDVWLRVQTIVFVITISMCLIWLCHLVVQTRIANARVEVLLSCTPGTPASVVIHRLAAGGKPRYTDTDLQ